MLKYVQIQKNGTEGRVGCLLVQQWFCKCGLWTLMGLHGLALGLMKVFLSYCFK
jgi:hypothetical protein